jgi:hypothetical protein
MRVCHSVINEIEHQIDLSLQVNFDILVDESSHFVYVSIFHPKIVEQHRDNNRQCKCQTYLIPDDEIWVISSLPTSIITFPSRISQEQHSSTSCS